MALNDINCHAQVLRNNPTLQKPNTDPVFEDDVWVNPRDLPIIDIDWPVAPQAGDNIRMLEQYDLLFDAEEAEIQDFIMEPGDTFVVTDNFAYNGVYLPITSARPYSGNTGQNYFELTAVRTRKRALDG